jgi:purine-binding chemotaxis protein CheW
MPDGKPCLLCRVRTWVCALPIDTVVETMRPLPIEPLASAPRFVRGVSIIRGEPVPVVDGGMLLSDSPLSSPRRLVTLEVSGRRVALAVDEVLGVRTVAASSTPPLLQHAHEDVVAAIETLDAELLVVLRTARLLPEELRA